MWAAFKRVIKPRGAIVLTASQPFTSALVMSNPTWFKYSWVWDKVRPVGFLNAKVRPMMRHEDVVVFCDSSPNYYPQMTPMKKTMARRSAASISSTNGFIQLRPLTGEYTENYPVSILEVLGVDNSERYHPTQKPVALFEYLIRTYTQPGDLVFDPTCGSGTTAVAARNCKRAFICGDQSAEYVAIARDRLRLPFEPRHVVRDNNVDDLPLFAGLTVTALPSENVDSE